MDAKVTCLLNILFSQDYKLSVQWKKRSYKEFLGHIGNRKMLKFNYNFKIRNANF